MPHYRFVLESEDGIQNINVNDAKSFEHALKFVRNYFPFKQWRIINVAEQDRRFD